MKAVFIMNIVEVLKKFVYDVWDFDKKIDATNPFSSVNYCNKKYVDFFSYYSPERRSVMVWVEDIDD